VVTIVYEAMVVGGALFATSIDSIARQNGLEPYPSTGDGLQVEVGSGKLIAGLDRGLQRMALGEQASLLFPFTLGYGKEYVGLVPPQSALRFDVLVIEIQ
jgi:FKBP-type peptidyl-prolyl cis-trans isomerase